MSTKCYFTLVSKQEPPKHFFRSRRSQDLEDAEETEQEEDGEEEDSMITSTVPPANPSEWPESSQVSLKPHHGTSLSSANAIASSGTPSSAAAIPPKIIGSSSSRGLTNAGVESGGDGELQKESPESDGQGGVIYMDINSKKNTKV